MESQEHRVGQGRTVVMCTGMRPLPAALALRPSEVVSDSRLWLSGSSRMEDT